MKRFIPIVTAVLAGIPTLGLAQTAPGAPEDNGLTPKSDTVYINRRTAEIDAVNNDSSESIGVAITSSGNVVVGWEDDGDGIQDFEAVWTLFDSAGVSLTPNTTVNSVYLGESISTKYLAYFRADGSAVFGGAAWGPKIKANAFGDGFGMGGTAYGLSLEVPEFVTWDDANQGDISAVQLIDNNGAPLPNGGQPSILAGISASFATRDARNIRIADWEYLSNGNIVVVSENRQQDDLIDLYGGDTAANHAIFRILTPAGGLVKAETIVSEVPVKSEIWHGVGVTKNGFAVRFAAPTGVTVRMFDNDGNPTTGNIDLATVTSAPQANSGGRGDSAGFHGNGKDAYVTAAASGSEVWVTVLNADGTLRYSKTVSDDLTLASPNSADAAIDADGNVVVVYSAKFDAANPNRLVMGRRFDATGKAVGKTFYVSEKELPDPNTGNAQSPRVAWRNGAVAVSWLSKNDLDTYNPDTGEPMDVVTLRLFSTFTPGSIESVGLTRIVADTPVVKTTANSLGNWEPYASVLGTSTFLIEGNTFAENETTFQRYVVALQPAAGGAMKLGEGFYGDNGQPFKGQINYSRQNGNPGRVGGDTRPGATTFVVGAEASPHLVSEFQGDNRWNLGFDRLGDGRYGTVQSYSLNTASLVQTPLSKAQDSAFGRLTSGAAAGNQISRFGGDVVFLSNGNFVSVVDDRSHALAAVDCVTATIFSPSGAVVKESWVVANGDIWSNVAAYKDGFAIRCKPQDGSANRVIYFYDNAGNLKGTADQATSGASFDTGRGDGTRIFGHINSPYVYLAGKVSNSTVVRVAAFDGRTQKFVAITDVSEGSFTGNFDRATGAVDALNRLTVSWVSQPVGYAKQQVAARVLSFDGTKFTALTKSFFPFVNVSTNDTIRTLQMSVAMTTRQICVAAKGEINYSNKPELGADSPTEVNFYTVISHPNPQDDPTAPATGEVPSLTITKNANNTITIAWPASATGFTLKSKASLSDATWTTVGTQNPATINIGAGNAYYRLEK